MGIGSMKTKIIYISGNELFDMADIRAAFDEVRAALSLDNDTILFGVPVDNDDVLAQTQPATTVIEQQTTHEDIEPAEPIVVDTPIEGETPVAPEKPKKRTRAKVIPISRDVETQESVEPVADAAEPVATPTDPVPEPSPVVPILSVLGTNTMTADDTDDVETPTDITPEPDIEPVSIDDMIADDAPVAETEKTLEELLESMTPLGEDTEPDTEPISIEPDQVPTDTADDENTDTDTDKTLEMLANEFVESQDKFETPAKPATRGKIGKLKNILPFKKAKRDDSGLMGDLFGWAGVAANDEDFTIPGFFTNATTNHTTDDDK